jgi:hypothetical protein
VVRGGQIAGEPIGAGSEDHRPGADIVLKPDKRDPGEGDHTLYGKLDVLAFVETLSPSIDSIGIDRIGVGEVIPAIGHRAWLETTIIGGRTEVFLVDITVGNPLGDDVLSQHSSWAKNEKCQKNQKTSLFDFED